MSFDSFLVTKMTVAMVFHTNSKEDFVLVAFFPYDFVAVSLLRGFPVSPV